MVGGEYYMGELIKTKQIINSTISAIQTHKSKENMKGILKMGRGMEKGSISLRVIEVKMLCSLYCMRVYLWRIVSVEKEG